jgi:hypothetical protein
MQQYSLILFNLKCNSSLKCHTYIKSILLPLSMTYVRITPKLIFSSFNPYYLLNQIIIHFLMSTKPGFADMDITDVDFND